MIVFMFAGMFVLGKGITLSIPKMPSFNDHFEQVEMLLLGEGTKQESQDNTKELEDHNQQTELEEVVQQPQKPQESESNTQGTGDGDDGQEDGLSGEEGGEEAEFDIAMIMKWYKYGSQQKYIVCGPSEVVSADINTAQLTNNELKYDFELTGEDAGNAHIISVSVKEGDSSYREIHEQGKLKINVPNASLGRDYTFKIDTIWNITDASGKSIEEEIIYTYVVHFAYALDAELELTWQKNNNRVGLVTCPANDTVARTIVSNDLTDNVFSYTPKIVGTLAKDAKIVSGEYTTSSGEKGSLEPNGGSIVFQTKSNADKEIYYLTFKAKIKDKDGSTQTVDYHVTIDFLQIPDIDVSFVWLEKGHTPRTLICQPNSKVSTDIKNNQLSAGAVKYEISLTGSDCKNARILSISYTSDVAGGGNLAASGALPMKLPEGYTSNTYKIQVVVLSGGKQLNYDINLKYALDVSLKMEYTVKEDGLSSRRIIYCENSKTKTAEPIYDDQLKDDKLEYRMSITGTETFDIKSVSCYQSGSKSTVTLDAADEIVLLLNAGKTGENTFTVLAEDNNGTTYQFRINIPYKHRGENNIKISTNMSEGQVVTNETKTNLNVKAWSVDENGMIVSYIPANGTDTKLIVKLDDEVLNYVSTSGPSSEFIMYPSNPLVGDTNRHTIYIYAEDSYGNYGELTINLKGQRSQAGQKKGTATIYIDMTVLGLGVVDSLNYEVLANEPISYSIVKAVLGKDTGDPFGAASSSLGWGGSYSGTLDKGFYLQRLDPGLSANGLEKGSWNKYGKNEKEILNAIDEKFGKGSGLATLWRCIYRNGLNKSIGTDGSYGEFDFTSGSGWLYSLNGTYYPGLSMSEYSLEDGDVLTLRYTLANGWDVGGGTPGYGNTIGYCVTAFNGNFYINHQMEVINNPNGSKSYVCHCCGLEEECPHQNTEETNLGDGTHITYCNDCKTEVGEPKLHVWKTTDSAHICSECNASEKHNWKEESNTATCTSGGKRVKYCTICNMTLEEDSQAKGHSLNKRWNHTKHDHYQKCSVCKEVIEESKGAHQYYYDEGDDDWYCKVCDAGHDWDYCGNSKLTIIEETCQKIVLYCNECELYFERTGKFDRLHSYKDGHCIYCGAANPGEPQLNDTRRKK